jgi:hypothetical protein
LTVLEIGCCGAYCKTCIKGQQTKYPNERSCQGCKLGYATGIRNLERAKCRIKRCCFKDHKLETCADCITYPCDILETFFSKGRKKYRKQLDLIRQYGYQEFLKNAEKWKSASGKLF